MYHVGRLNGKMIMAKYLPSKAGIQGNTSPGILIESEGWINAINITTTWREIHRPTAFIEFLIHWPLEKSMKFHIGYFLTPLAIDS